MKNKQIGWKKAFCEEFSIHFKNNKDELKFALAFIEDLLGVQKKEIIEMIKNEFKNMWQDDWTGEMKNKYIKDFIKMLPILLTPKHLLNN